jgi:hypothetical protein
MNPTSYVRAKSSLLVVVFVISSTLVAKTASDPCAELAHARGFSFFTSVAAGTVVSGTRAFSQVLHRPNPASCFKQLVRTGSNEAKMYAMVGLRELDHRQFDIEWERLMKRNFTVVILATAQQGTL